MHVHNVEENVNHGDFDDHRFYYKVTISGANLVINHHNQNLCRIIDSESLHALMVISSLGLCMHGDALRGRGIVEICINSCWGRI